jgi:hypothetical protein
MYTHYVHTQTLRLQFKKKKKKNFKLFFSNTNIYINICIYIQRLRGDFDHQLEELGEIGKVIDKLITTMTPK